MSASSSCEAPARTAETSARSAPSASRTSMNPRSQRPSRSGSAVAGQRLEREARRLHGRVGSDVGEPVVEGRGPLFTLETGHEVHQAGERRQPARPAAPAPLHAELEPGPERIGPGRVGLDEHDRRLRDHERDVALEPDLQPRSLVGDAVARRSQVDVDVVAVDLDREAAQLVGPLVERAARAEVEARVVPVAGEDPVRDRAAMEREAHVRAAVVDREHRAVLGEQADVVTVERDDEAACLDAAPRARQRVVAGQSRQQSRAEA